MRGGAMLLVIGCVFLGIVGCASHQRDPALDGFCERLIEPYDGFNQEIIGAFIMVPMIVRGQYVTRPLIEMNSNRFVELNPFV